MEGRGPTIYITHLILNPWLGIDDSHSCPMSCPLQIMRHVVSHPSEAAEKGRAARRLMKERYSPEAVARIIAYELDGAVDRKKASGRSSG
jgi:hypothetical protein